MKYYVDATVAEDAIVEAVGARWTVTGDGPTRSVSTYLDTGDWRVYKARGTLAFVARGAAQELVWWTGEVSRTEQLDCAEPPSFATDLPAGPYRDALHKASAGRRLFPIATLTSERTLWRVLDREGKTRVRFALRRDTACGPDGAPHALPVRLEIQPVRGYDKARRKLESLLERFETRAVDDTPLADVIPFLPRSPVGYVHRIAHDLAPTMRADEAAKAVHLRLLQRIENTREGAAAHLDSVFVKDLRVAVRRTRVALSQIRDVFPPDRAEHFRAEFGWLGKTTGPARDLDVYLGRLPTYAGWLPASTRSDLDELTAFLAARQADAQAALAAALRSARCDHLLADWRAFLESAPVDDPAAPNAGRPVTELASARIWKAYRRLHDEGSVITPETPADPLHALRLRGKKLRYIVSFFRSLYPSKQIDALLEPLEALQDNLGDFQDFEVQQTTLLRFAQEMTDAGTARPETLIAMGRLVAELDVRQREARAGFADCFAGVAAPEARAEYKSLFRTRRPTHKEDDL